MANFCTQCGTTLNSDARFCTRCGATVAAPSPAAASATPASPAGSVTAATQPAAAAPAPAKSNGALKVVLIVLGVFIGLGILAGAAVMFGIWGLSRAVQVDPGGEKVRIATPLGAMTMGTTEVTEAELGIPIYPGAEGESGSFSIGTSEGAMGSFVFYTTDSPEQVLEFYRSRLGESVEVVTTPQGGVISSAPTDREGYMITVGLDEGENRTVIGIIRGIAAQ